MLLILDLLSFHVHVRIILSREVVNREDTEVYVIVNYKGSRLTEKEEQLYKVRAYRRGDWQREGENENKV